MPLAISAGKVALTMVKDANGTLSEFLCKLLISHSAAPQGFHPMRCGRLS